MNNGESPYQPPNSDLNNSNSKNCPNCDTRFTLSWSNYLKNPFGGYKCSKCHAKFKLKHTLLYRIWFALWMIIYFAGLVVIVIKTKDNDHNGFYYLAWFIVMLIIYLPIDKKLESNLNVQRNEE